MSLKKCRKVPVSERTNEWRVVKDSSKSNRKGEPMVESNATESITSNNERVVKDSSESEMRVETIVVTTVTVS